MLHNFVIKSKKYREEILLSGILFLVALAAFGLGRLSVSECKEPIELLYPTRDNAPQLEGAALQALPLKKSPETNTQHTTSVPTQGGEGVIASKNGSVYHFPWCAGAQKMKEENKVFYESIEAARAAGLRPAANCPGLE